jgi:hypothetical protein
MFKVGDLVKITTKSGPYSHSNLVYEITAFSVDAEYVQLDHDGLMHVSSIVLAGAVKAPFQGPIFKPGDQVKVKPGIQTWLHEDVIYIVERVSYYIHMVKLEGHPALFLVDSFIMATGKNDVPQKSMTYEEVVNLRTNPEESEFESTWNFPVFPMPEPCGKCECGSDAINGGSHSTWCPAHQK